MAKFVFGMNVSLDGYVDHDRFAPDPVLFQHWVDQVHAVKVCLYGRKIYGIMQYFEEDQPGWGRPSGRLRSPRGRSTNMWCRGRWLRSGRMRR